MTIAPPGHHVVKEHIRRNPTRRRKTATNAGAGVGLAIGAVVVAFVLTSGGDGPKPKQQPGSGQPIQQQPVAAPADGVPGAQQPVDQAAAPPAANGPAVGAGPTTAYARQHTLILRSTPNVTSPAVATVAYDAPVTLVCHTTGPATRSFTGRNTTVWDKVTTADGKTGFVSDGGVLTSAQVDQLVPAC